MIWPPDNDSHQESCRQDYVCSTLYKWSIRERSNSVSCHHFDMSISSQYAQTVTETYCDSFESVFSVPSELWCVAADILEVWRNRIVQIKHPQQL